MNTSSVLKAFGLDTDYYELKLLGSRLINTRWVVNETSTNKAFVLQQVNDKVFKHLEDRAHDKLSGRIPSNLVPFITQTVVETLKKLIVFGNDYNMPDGTNVKSDGF